MAERELFTSVRAQARKAVVEITLGTSGLDVTANGEPAGTIGPTLSLQMAEAVIERWGDAGEARARGCRPAENGIRLQYWCGGEVVWEAMVDNDYPIPLARDQIDIGSDRYFVLERVWVLAGDGTVGVGVCVHLRHMLKRRAKPPLGALPETP